MDIETIPLPAGVWLPVPVPDRVVERDDDDARRIWDDAVRRQDRSWAPTQPVELA